MARASFITKKDGRYWFQKRFGVGNGKVPGLPTHCRIALRTADYRQAVARMLKVVHMVQAFEIQADIVDRATVLVAQMQRFNMKAGGHDGDALVERRALETLVTRFITEPGSEIIR